MAREILKMQCKIMDNKLNKILANFYLTQTIFVNKLEIDTLTFIIKNIDINLNLA